MTQKRVQPNTAIDMRGATGEQWDEVERILKKDGYEFKIALRHRDYIFTMQNQYTNAFMPINFPIHHTINHTDLCTSAKS
jgi:hypothetical protein